MSWDIIIQDFPQGVTDINDISDDFAPKMIGMRADLIARIQAIFPVANFSDPSRGVLEGDGYSIEFGMGSDAECDVIMLNVRGGSWAVIAVTAVVEHLGLRAYDIGAEDFFSPIKAQASFAEWQVYRDKVVSRARPFLPETPDGPAAGK